MQPGVYFLRNKQGRQLDALVETGARSLLGVEIKSGATVANDIFNGLNYWRERLSSVTLDPWLVYGGDSQQRRTLGHVVPWNNFNELLDAVLASG